MIGPTWLVGVSISVHLVNRSRLCCGPFSSTEFAKCAFCAGDRAASVASETWDEQKATSCTILLHPFNIETHRNTWKHIKQRFAVFEDTGLLIIYHGSIHFGVQLLVYDLFLASLIENLCLLWFL